MKFKPKMKEKPFLVIVIAVAIMLIFCIVLFMSGFFQESGNYENEKVIENMTLDELNETLDVELNWIDREKAFVITKREVDENQKTITLYEIYMNEDQIAELQGKEIGDWKISVIPDTEYMDEIEAIHAEIWEMRKIPELQISASSFTVSPDIKEVELWVYNRAPENQALKGKVIHGWKIRVYVCSPPPPKEE